MFTSYLECIVNVPEDLYCGGNTVMEINLKLLLSSVLYGVFFFLLWKKASPLIFSSNKTTFKKISDYAVALKSQPRQFKCIYFKNTYRNTDYKI